MKKQEPTKGKNLTHLLLCSIGVCDSDVTMRPVRKVPVITVGCLHGCVHVGGSTQGLKLGSELLVVKLTNGLLVSS